MRFNSIAAWIGCAVFVTAFVGGSDSARSQPIGQAPTCDLPEPGRRWLQEALDGWSRVREEALGLGRGPLPWLVLFDETCVWHLSPDHSILSAPDRPTADLSLNGTSLPVFAAPHAGRVLLPNGRVMSPRATASTSVYGNGSATFSVVSMFGVWERDPRHAREPQLGEFFQGLLVHELTHSTQLVGVIKRVAALRRAHTMPGIVDDDVVQRRFALVPQFRKAIDAERDAFYRAALSADKATQREWATKGLSMARKRRARFYTGHLAAFSDLEDAFFAMEGSAQWAAYRWARWQFAPTVTDEAVIRFVRADRKYWSQDEGLALYLLIDALVPEWQKRTFGDAIASPFSLLDDALSQRSSR
jgi:hypothetical protein